MDNTSGRDDDFVLLRPDKLIEHHRNQDGGADDIDRLIYPLRRRRR